MSTPLRVLIVEDSPADAQLLLHELRRAGYEPTFERIDSGVAMQQALDRQSWDVVLADYVLPGFSGLAALDLLRSRGIDLPFIIVSGQIGEDVAVEAMKAGAHDYIIKGHLARLVPAVQRELRDAEVRRERRRAEAERDRLMEQLREVNERLVTSSIWIGERAWESELRGAELEAVLGCIAEAVIIFDADGNISRINRAAERFLGNVGLNAEPPLAEQLGLLRIEAEGGRRLSVEDASPMRALGGEPCWEVELTIYPTGGGAPIQVSASAVPIRTPDGKLFGTVAVIAMQSPRQIEA